MVIVSKREQMAKTEVKRNTVDREKREGSTTKQVVFYKKQHVKNWGKPNKLPARPSKESNIIHLLEEKKMEKEEGELKELSKEVNRTESTQDIKKEAGGRCRR